jgi:hypothetical protein
VKNPSSTGHLLAEKTDVTVANGGDGCESCDVLSKILYAQRLNNAVPFTTDSISVGYVGVTVVYLC